VGVSKAGLVKVNNTLYCADIS